MFRRLDAIAGAPGAPVTLVFEGRAVPARAGESVAAALLAAGIADFGANPVSGRPRGPYCLIGACFECRLAIDGVAGCQACMVEVADRMVVERAAGIAEVSR